MNEHVKPETVSAEEEKRDPFTIKLSKPLDTHSGLVSVIKLRALNAGDFIDINGLPFGLKAGEAKIDFKVALAWLSRLSGIDELILRRLGQRDWMVACASVHEILISDGDIQPGNSMG